jgi:hypothetical protein
MPSVFSFGAKIAYFEYLHSLSAACRRVLGKRVRKQGRWRVIQNPELDGWLVVQKKFLHDGKAKYLTFGVDEHLINVLDCLLVSLSPTSPGRARNVVPSSFMAGKKATVLWAATRKPA